jgi:hypothetical protein
LANATLIRVKYSNVIIFVQGYCRLNGPRNPSLAEIKETKSLSLVENKPVGYHLLGEEKALDSLSLAETRAVESLSLAETKAALVCLARKLTRTAVYYVRKFIKINFGLKRDILLRNACKLML